MTTAPAPMYPPRVGVRLMPSTRLGRWSVGLLTVLVLGAAAQAFLVNALGIRGAWLAVFGGPALTAGLAACPTGVLALLKRHERSLLVALAAIVGLFVWFLLVGEFVWQE